MSEKLPMTSPTRILPSGERLANFTLLKLIGKGFNALDVEGTVLMDPTKTGAGLSKYYRARVA
jgi:hypothetical protein